MAKDGINTTYISAGVGVVSVFEASLHGSSLTVADTMASDGAKKNLLYKHSSTKEKQESNDESKLNSLEIVKIDQASSKEFRRSNPKRIKTKSNEKLLSERLGHHAEFECSFCKKVFFRKCNLTVHINNYHSQGYWCSQCKFSVNDKNTFWKHVSSHSRNVLQEKTNEKLPPERLKHKKTNNKLPPERLKRKKTNEKLPPERLKLAKIQCSFCNNTFSRQNNLTVHIAAFHSQVYQCSECEFSINDKKKYLKHVSSHGEKVLKDTKIKMLPPEKLKKHATFVCSYCNHISNRKSNLKAHIEKVHSQVYQCSQCEFSINDRNKYLKHVSSHKSFKCPQCHLNFACRFNLDTHVTCVHEKLKNFKCSFCDFISGTRGNLNLHIRAVHQKFKPFKCTLCVSSFHRKEHLTGHIIAAHRKGKRLKCLHCDFSASFTKNLAVHTLAKHSGERERPFKCSSCSKSYFTNWQLKFHYSSVHDKTKLKCRDCSFITGYKRSLIRHFRIHHLNKEIYKCSRCKFYCNNAKQLRTHVSTNHEKVKLFQCVECGFTAANKWNLKGHILAKHLKTGPFLCEECNYTFSGKRSLNGHIRAIHLKKLKCTQCEFTCNGKRELFVHRNSVHEKIDPYQCDDCGYVSNYKWNVVCHMRRAHKK